MTRVCTVCRHEQRYDIDTFLVDRSKSYRDIALQFGLSKDAVSRHVNEGHIAKLISLAAEAQRVAKADTLLDRLEGLQRRTEAIVEEAEKTGNFRDRFRGVAEMRRNLELIGEITKELNRSTTINLELNPEWGMIRAAIVEALEPAPPQIRGAVSLKLLQIEGGVLPNGDS